MFTFLKNMLCEQNGWPSSKRGVLAAITATFTGTITWHLFKNIDVPTNITSLLEFALGVAITGVAGGRMLENKAQSAPKDPAPTEPDSTP